MKKIDAKAFNKIIERGNLNTAIELIKKGVVEPSIVKEHLANFNGEELIDVIETVGFDKLFTSFEEYFYSDCAIGLQEMSLGGMILGCLNIYPEDIWELFSKSNEEEKKRLSKIFSFKNRNRVTFNDVSDRVYMSMIEDFMEIEKKMYGLSEQQVSAKFVTWSPVITKQFLKEQEDVVGSKSILDCLYGRYNYKSLPAVFEKRPELSIKEIDEVFSYLEENGELYRNESVVRTILRNMIGCFDINFLLRGEDGKELVPEKTTIEIFERIKRILMNALTLTEGSYLQLIVSEGSFKVLYKYELAYNKSMRERLIILGCRNGVSVGKYIKQLVEKGYEIEITPQMQTISLLLSNNLADILFSDAFDPNTELMEALNTYQPGVSYGLGGLGKNPFLKGVDFDIAITDSNMREGYTRAIYLGDVSADFIYAKIPTFVLNEIKRRDVVNINLFTNASRKLYTIEEVVKIFDYLGGDRISSSEKIKTVEYYSINGANKEQMVKLISSCGGACSKNGEYMKNGTRKLFSANMDIEGILEDL